MTRYNLYEKSRPQIKRTKQNILFTFFRFVIFRYVLGIRIAFLIEYVWFLR